MYKDMDIIEFIEHSNWIEGVYSMKQDIISMGALKYIQKKKFLNLECILKTHKKIMIELNPRIAGRLRDVDVRVGARICPSSGLVSGLLGEWIETYGKGVKTEAEAKEAHIYFEHIHPFRDGNGRVGRMIWLWHRQKARLQFDMIKLAEKYEYYKWF